jgi:tRNA-Thr(GGU) m(6)t(6)A37 methyltransferase TsaA
LHLNRIGTLHTPFSTRDDCPRNGRQPNPPPLCHAALLPEFHEGLLGLDGFSHLVVLYWLHQAAFRGELVFTPPFDDAPRGLFATRAPARPNPIGLSVVAFDGYELDHRLRLYNLDCIDGTPLLDIKPYLRTTDAEPCATLGWLARHAAARPAE